MARAVYLFSDSLVTALRQRGRLEGSGPEHYRWVLRWAGDVLRWGSAAVRALRCCQSLAKGRGLQHRLFLFYNLSPSALPCTGCGSSSRRSPGSSRGLPCVRVLRGDQNLKQPWEKSVEPDPSPAGGTCTANRVPTCSLIQQPVPILSRFRAKFQKLKLCQMKRTERNKSSDRLNVKKKKTNQKSVPRKLEKQIVKRHKS